jgi:TonB family protein
LEFNPNSKYGEQVKLDDYTLILLSDNKTGSFSFFKWMVISRFDYENNPDPILQHEMVHIRQWHSLDILLIEIIKVVFWFNPTAWLYKHSLQEVHEFLADETAPNRDHYARFLVSYSFSVPAALLTNHFFNSSILKNRIKMIYKNRNSRWSLGKYLMIVPVILFALLMTAARKKLINPEENKASTTAKIFSQNAIQEVASHPIVSTSMETIAKPDTEKVNIEGDILRESGLGIAEVNVFVQGTNIAAVTDPLGHFKLSDIPLGSVVTASYVGYIPQTFVVEKEKTNYRLTLQKGQNELKVPVFTVYKDILKFDEERIKEKEAARLLSSTKEQPPQFPGGEEAMYKYIQNNIRYPKEALGVSVGGIALVSFTINRNGDVRNPKAVKEIGWGIDEEAIRLVLNMPRWEPARQNGEPVSMEYTISIHFTIQGAVATKEKYQGNSRSDKQGDKYRYFSNYNLPDSAAASKFLTKVFEFSDSKEPKKPELPDVSKYRIGYKFRHVIAAAPKASDSHDQAH